MTKQKTLTNTLKVVGLTAVLTLAGCAETETEKEAFSEKESEEWVGEFVSAVLEDQVSLAEATELLEEGKDRASSDDFNEAAEILLYTLEMEESRFNELLYALTPEVERILREHPELSFEEEDGWKEVEWGVVKGLRKEIDEQPFSWMDTEDMISVFVDYDTFLANYEDNLSPVLVNKVALTKHRKQHDEYNRELSIIDFENVFDRLVMLDGFKEAGEWDEAFDAQYYYHTTMLYGFGEASMNYDTGEFNDKALDAMTKVAKENEGHIVADHMLTLVELVKKEGSYNEAVMDKANGIMNEQFKEYLESIEESVGEESGEDE